MNPGIAIPGHPSVSSVDSVNRLLLGLAEQAIHLASKLVSALVDQTVLVGWAMEETQRVSLLVAALGYGGVPSASKIRYRSGYQSILAIVNIYSIKESRNKRVMEMRVLPNPRKCPHCGAYAQFTYEQLHYREMDYKVPVDFMPTNIWQGKCLACEQYIIINGFSVVYPEESNAPPIKMETPHSIKEIATEARMVHSQSPRASSALLRLALEMLLQNVLENNNKLNDNISILLERGIEDDLRRALEVIRIFGNEGVHPGTINLNDDEQSSIKLFNVFNYIVTRFIVEKGMIKEMYGIIPEEKREKIEEKAKKK